MADASGRRRPRRDRDAGPLPVLASAVPGARLEVFEGAAHMVNLEQPDRFNRLLRAFLDAHRQG